MCPCLDSFRDDGYTTQFPSSGCRGSYALGVRTKSEHSAPWGVDRDAKGEQVVKLKVRDRESIQEAVRRFRKLVERSGIKKEMRRKEYYEKPSESKRRAKLRAERRARRNRIKFGR